MSVQSDQTETEGCPPTLAVALPTFVVFLYECIELRWLLLLIDNCSIYDEDTTHLSDICDVSNEIVALIHMCNEFVLCNIIILRPIFSISPVDTPRGPPNTTLNATDTLQTLYAQITTSYTRPVTAAIAIREHDTPLDDGVKAMVETATATVENKILDAVYRGHTTVYRERHREGVEESERPMAAEDFVVKRIKQDQE
ncbi:hypothetical protein PILCRDRAFT_13248 [Piloderma croceum F 1598]|uniref:Uncharacterized protein n=1 Tax=Piloderma croceum (strain F 1598) TaxID=765440 RepID=A0A0C3ETL6_PILCF|nr:hypothetical protein PILCRDRAFT_13248 [Piloderma croceum F 1598]